MSYYVTITRKPNPCWKGGELISEAEWRRVALAEPDFRPATDAELVEVAPYGRPSDLVWTGHPNFSAVWFDWFEGQIDVKGPDEITLAKMGLLAARLGANMIGENGELYDATGKCLGAQELPVEPGTQRQPAWARTKGRLVTTFLILLALAGILLVLYLVLGEAWEHHIYGF